MNKYFFNFGYEDPFEMESNSKYGTDFESSTGVFIEAENEEEAIIWGRKIAEEFYKYIHQDKSISWKGSNFAYWIEYDVKSSDWDHYVNFFPLVKLNEMPILSNLTTEAYLEWKKQNGENA